MPRRPHSPLAQRSVKHLRPPQQDPYCYLVPYFTGLRSFHSRCKNVGAVSGEFPQAAWTKDRGQIGMTISRYLFHHYTARSIAMPCELQWLIYLFFVQASCASHVMCPAATRLLCQSRLKRKIFPILYPPSFMPTSAIFPQHVFSVRLS